MNPKVKFELNKTLDKRMALEFLGMEQGGTDFSRGIINVHPELKKLKETKSETERRRSISGYFDAFYKEHDTYLKSRVREFQKEWGEVEKGFLKEVNKIFKGHPFPKGKYVGYLSITDCNPRFLEDKTFQIFYQHPDGASYVTAHELLHFIFYDYAVKRHSELFKGANTEKGIFWNAAEIFNSVILHTPNFTKIHGLKKRRVYPNHKNHMPKLAAIWQKSQDIDELITATYDLLGR